jgi:hypothetical protein
VADDSSMTASQYPVSVALSKDSNKSLTTVTPSGTVKLPLNRVKPPAAPSVVDEPYVVEKSVLFTCNQRPPCV